MINSYCKVILIKSNLFGIVFAEQCRFGFNKKGAGT